MNSRAGLWACGQVLYCGRGSGAPTISGVFVSRGHTNLLPRVMFLIFLDEEEEWPLGVRLESVDGKSFAGRASIKVYVLHVMGRWF